MNKSQIIVLGIISLSFIVALSFYGSSCLPDRLASHWNARGQVDGYLPKFWGLFLMPLISLPLFGLFVLAPKIDPLKENIKGFRKYYDGFIVLIIAFLFYLQLLTIAWNVGLRFDLLKLLVPVLSIVFFAAWILMEHAKRNWFIGVRTPWTLSSDSVWDKTHRLGGKLFKATALVSLLGFFWADGAFLFLILPALASGLFIVFYSYYLYRQEAKK
ncbi:MAG: SdpI family protein [Candidatus Nealsonbacteria bacterium]|nr:SdpI family protein [Candidatus Nealsonbacteria bacterium]